MNEHAPIKLSEPGVYDLPIDVYHSQCCAGPSLSSTGIRRLLRSPAHFWKYSELNPAHEEEDDKEAFILGRAAHHLILGEKNFFKHFIISIWPDFRTDKAKAWREEQIEAGLTVLTNKQVEKIRGMAGLLPWQKGMTNCGLANTPLVMAGALSGAIEKSLIWKYGNVWLKARPDSIPGDSDDYSDLKTHSPKNSEGMTDRELGNVMHDRKYHVQGGMVGMGAHEVLKRRMTGFHVIFVDTGDVHAVSVRTVDEADLIIGERSVDVGVRIFERCLDSGIWPGPTARQADAMKLSLPQWSRDAQERHLDLLTQEYAA